MLDVYNWEWVRIISKDVCCSLHQKKNGVLGMCRSVALVRTDVSGNSSSIIRGNRIDDLRTLAVSTNWRKLRKITELDVLTWGRFTKRSTYIVTFEPAQGQICKKQKWNSPPNMLWTLTVCRAHSEMAGRVSVHTLYPRNAIIISVSDTHFC
jgi:hypothetical protein